MATPFDVFIVTPERELWSGRATIVVARGTEGEVGILAGVVDVGAFRGVVRFVLEQLLDTPR